MMFSFNITGMDYFRMVEKGENSTVEVEMEQPAFVRNVQLYEKDIESSRISAI